ncbi:NmrA-like protein [Ilyonectria robusta]
MSSLRTILIVGAMGAQGMPVVHALAQSGRYAVQTMTRSAESHPAKEIASLPNISLCVGDCLDVMDLNRAFKGVHSAFINTNRRSTTDS